MAVTGWQGPLPQVRRPRETALGLRCGGWGSTLRCTGTQHTSDTAPTRCSTLLKERGGMTTSTVRFTEERVKVAGTELYILKGGSGPPVLVFHGVEGFEGRLAFHDALAEQATVYAPSHPGYGQTPCP